MLKLLYHIRSLKNDTRGAALIEGAIMMPIFLLFMFIVFELALVMWGNSIISNVLTQVAVESTRGCEDANVEDGNCLVPAAGVTRARLNTLISQKGNGFIDPARLCFTADTLQNAPTTLSPAATVNLGQSEETVVLYASYQWPLYFGPMQTYFGNFTTFRTAIIARNEAFGSITNVQRVSPVTGICL